MKNCKKTLALVLSVLTLAATLSACSGGKSTDPNAVPSATPSTTGEPKMGGDLSVGIAQDMDVTLDPHKIVSAGTRELLFNVYEGLVKPDTAGNLIPALAEKYEISTDGRVFTFTLRKNVKFHNGAPLTTADVCYSIARAAGLNADKPLIDSFKTVESVEATDDSTVVITTKESNIEFLAQLTAGIIPDGSNPDSETIGTGPFKFVSRSPLENVIIEKYSDYWGTPAYVDKVTYKIIDSGETLVMSLKSGALNLVAHLTGAQAAELGPDFTILEGTMNLVQAVYLNHTVAPFDNIKVRQALSHAIDRQMIMDLLADGRGSAVGSSMYPSFEKYFVPELVNTYNLDTQLAKSLLAEAGYPNGFSFNCTVPSNYQPHIDTAEIIAQQLKAIGVTLNVRLVDWGTWVDETYLGRNFESTIVGVDASSMTARAMLERFTSTAGDNFINYTNSKYDDTFKAALAASDDDQQTKLYKEMQTILTEDAANLYIQDLCDLVAMDKTIGGYEFYPLYVMDMAKVYFTA